MLKAGDNLPALWYAAAAAHCFKVHVPYRNSRLLVRHRRVCLLRRVSYVAEDGISAL